MLWSIFDEYGHRKYLNRHEVHDFLEIAKAQSAEVHGFCRLLAETGCRISEALAIDHDHIDTANLYVIFETLKRRRKGVFRRVPISRGLVALLLKIGDVRRGNRIWSWSRTTAWRHVTGVLDAAGVTGPQATPKGFRHGFAVAALGAGAPLNLVQRWLGHSDIQTTSIYAVAVGPEEREIVSRVWQRYHQDAQAPTTARARAKQGRSTQRSLKRRRSASETGSGWQAEPVYFL
ncbi:tyrosine-type recombinase/integrase [Sphingomonas fennica]|uniref:Integrase n=1 Tax=Edaphosphingomonas fennica TaxID=114404 RepID=A0A2T4HUT8_9SPHN|nr:site-specific integrase [Sphingomonas fennica]PTD19573.1 integrase [Sphingomonas fennica]